jgi:dTDP-4-dehydrorhamnose reductase
VERHIKVLVLGADGMLGNKVYTYLKESGVEVYGSSRRSSLLNMIYFDACEEIANQATMIEKLNHCDYVINCIGLIKPKIIENEIRSINDALEINSLFPKKLDLIVSRLGKRSISIATDCVYDGDKGSYDELSPYSPVDVYGKSKLLGEVVSGSSKYLRCSIVGPEIYNKVSLLEWFKSIESGKEVNGYDNHFWNGVSTLAFSKVLLSILENQLFDSLPGILHLVPKDVVTKFEMLNMFKLGLGRDDIVIKKINTAKPLNRTLSSNYFELNTKLWDIAGYKSIPRIENLILEMLDAY